MSKKTTKHDQIKQIAITQEKKIETRNTIQNHSTICDTAKQKRTKNKPLQHQII